MTAKQGVIPLASSSAGAGTVTSVSVATANGFAGTVATPTTTPAITLTTPLTGVLKGTGTALAAATSGTDFSQGTAGLATGILKSTTTTGALTIAVAGDFPTLNQNTTGTAAGLSATLAIASGGTNSTGTPTAGGVAYGTGTAYAVTAAKTTGTVWLSGGAGAPTTTTGTLALAGNLATVGAFASTFTMTGVTGVTFPTSGTLLSTAAAVTVAQGGTGLGTLTLNNVILGNGTSAPTFVAPGSSGNVLTSNGTTWASTAPAGGGAWTLLSTVTAASSATVDVDTTFSSTYDAYVIVFSGITVVTDSVQLLLQMKLGGTYASAGYFYHTTENLSSSASYAAVNSTGTSSIEVARTLRNSSDASANLEVWVYNPSSTAFYKQVSFKGTSANTAAGVVTSIAGAGLCQNSLGALTGIRFSASSGNILAGKARLYGIANT